MLRSYGADLNFNAHGYKDLAPPEQRLGSQKLHCSFRRRRSVRSAVNGPVESIPALTCYLQYCNRAVTNLYLTLHVINLVGIIEFGFGEADIGAPIS